MKGGMGEKRRGRKGLKTKNEERKEGRKGGEERRRVWGPGKRTGPSVRNRG
jgi:hypothetical protein